MSGVAQVRLVIVLGLGATALYGAYRHGVTVTHAARDAQWAQAVAAQQVEQVRAVQAARDDEQRFQRQANQVGIDARKELAAANADAVGLDASGDRLHIEAPALPALPTEARQPPAPPWCSPNCSSALMRERETWRRLMTAPE
jgi:hypothetical protein